MGPDRTTKTTKRRKHSNGGKHPIREEGGASLPGVQKIKSAIRQTQRLLAKDKLAADVRVETERRLKALEGELEDAERSRKERALAVKYHKVKFFEKKKVLRRIKQIKLELDANSSSKEPATELEHRLFDLRIDLNYILHYPKLEKYISLFLGQKAEEEEEEEPEVGTDSTNSKRQEIRRMIQDRMEAGELSNEPEMHLQDVVRTVSDKQRSLFSSSKNSVSGRDRKSNVEPRGKSKKKKVDVRNVATNEMKGDDFFDIGDDS